MRRSSAGAVFVRARRPSMGQVLISPRLHAVKDEQKALPQPRQRILDPGRNLAEIVADDKAVRLQLPQLFRQGTLGDLSNLAAKLPEAPHVTFSDVPEELNFYFPSSSF